MNTGSIYVKAGWLVDGRGGRIIKNSLMEVSGGVIKSISGEKSPVPTESVMVDFSCCTIIPGLVDSHVHLSMSGIDDPDIRQEQLAAGYEGIKNVISQHLMDHLKCGVIAVRDGGDHSGHVLRYSQEDFSREPFPICLKVAGRAWHAEGRYGRLIGHSPLRGQSLSESISKDHKGINHIKIVNSGLNSLSVFGKETSSQFGLRELREAVIAGNRLGLKTMVHANGREAVRTAIEAGCHSIEHGFFMGDENLQMMAEKGVTWVPTLFTMDAYCRISNKIGQEYEVASRNLDHMIGQVSRALKCGVIIAAGTDSGSPGVHHGHAVREEIRLLISAGLSVQQAVRCATMNGAELLGMKEHFGVLSPDMPATFVVARGNPEELPGILAAPEAVWVRGKSVIHHPAKGL